MAETFRDGAGFLKTNTIVYLENEENGVFLIINAREGFEYTTGQHTTAEFSAVATGEESGGAEIEVLEPNQDISRMYQVFAGVEDGCTYYLQISAGTDRFGLDRNKDVGRLTNKNSPAFAMNPIFEFFLVENWKPTVNVHNDTGLDVTPELIFEGMKLDMIRLTSKNVNKYTKFEKLQEILQNPNDFFRLRLGGVNVK